MEIKILQVFYDKNGLPYKDKERQVHFPIVGNAFQGASNTTKIRFYYDELDMDNETTFVAVSKLPNGKIGSKILENFFDEELNENFSLLELDSFYTQANGDLFISLQGYQGGVRVEQDEQGIYQIYGTPTIQATGSIKLSINYATQFVGSGEEENVTLQRIFAYLGTKLGIRATTELVGELPTVGQTDVFYAIYNDPQDANKLNIYVWNETTQEYVWVGDNTLDLGDYYTQEQGEQFEQEIDARVSSVENELSSVTSGAPSGVYADVTALTSAHPTGDNKIYVCLDTGDWYYWNSTNSEWISGGNYLSTGNALDIPTADKNYTSKIDFLGTIGKNELDLMSAATMTDGKYVDFNTGAIGNATGYSASDYIEVLYNSLFIVPNGTNFFVAFYGKSKTYISGFNLSAKPFLKIPNNPNIVYMRFSVPNTSLTGLFVKMLKYVDEKEQNELSSIVGIKQVNLINGFIDGKYVSQGSGYYIDEQSYTSILPIEVIPNAKYKLIGSTTSGSQGAFYDKDGNYISGFVSGTETELVIPNNPNIKYMTWCSLLADKSNLKIYIDDYIASATDNSYQKVVSNLIPLIQGKENNLVDLNDTIDGYYVNYNSGNISPLSDFSVTGFIEITPDVSYIARARNSGGSQCAFYDKDKVYISGVVTGIEKTFTAPATARYIRWCFKTSDKPIAYLTYQAAQAYYEITPAIGLLQGLLNAYEQGYTKIVVRAGTYDIIEEYEEKYGNDYFTNYSSNYNNYINGNYDAGLWLENIEIVFDQGTKVIANYTGNNTYVKQYFSAFAVGRNVIIDGLVLEASELRYGLHPDFNGIQTEQTYLIVKNGDYSFVKGDANCQSFGCGLGKSCLWIFENNIFRTPLDSNLAVVRIHNNGNDNVQSKIIFRNNYIFGKGRFQLNYYGPSQKITDILICGNSWINPPQKANETAEENYDNFNLIVYNNETRS